MIDSSCYVSLKEAGRCRKVRDVTDHEDRLFINWVCALRG